MDGLGLERLSGRGVTLNDVTVFDMIASHRNERSEARPGPPI
jgi:hypothetical protein